MYCILIVYYSLFVFYILGIFVLAVYDAFHLKQMTAGMRIGHSMFVWVSAVAVMISLYYLGKDGMKFFLVPDIVEAYCVIGFILYGASCIASIKKDLDK